MLKYTPTRKNLEKQSISLDALHFGGWTELNTHTLFGALQTKATFNWFQSQGKRPMALGLSSYSGLGKYGALLKTSQSTFEDATESIVNVMSRNIGGVQLTGSYVCGLDGNSTAELCARWYMLSAF